VDEDDEDDDDEDGVDDMFGIFDFILMFFPPDSWW
jgi:hypothetical protein